MIGPTDTTLVVGGGHRFSVGDYIEIGSTGEYYQVVQDNGDTINVIRNVLPDPDYEAAEDLIREVVSEQDPEAQNP